MKKATACIKLRAAAFLCYTGSAAPSPIPLSRKGGGKHA